MPNSAAIPPSWFMRNRIKLRQLQLVSVLGESRNLRRAAARLAMTQPTATRLLHEIETALGVTLFERSRRGMEPTLYGTAMIQHAQALLSDLDAAHDSIRALADGAAGTLTIGAMASTASVVLPRSIAAIARERPELRISVIEGAHEMLAGALRRGEIDLMLGRVTGGAQMDDLDYEVLYGDEFRVVCGRKNPLARARRLRLASLADERWILPPPTMPLRQRFDIQFMAQAGVRPHNAIESVSLLTNLSLLQEARMLAVMPADIAHHFALLRLVHVLPLALKDLYGPVAIITRSKRPRTPPMEAFIEVLRATAASTGMSAEQRRSAG